MRESPFRLRLPPATGARGRRLASLALSVVEHALSLRRLDGLFRSLPPDLPVAELCRTALETLGVRVEVDPRDLDVIPASGPTVIVANHPFGGLEGIVLAALLAGRRPDLRLFASDLVARIPELRPVVIAGPPRAAAGWLREGGLLAVFPAGQVSHLDLRRRCVSDPPWRARLAALIERTDATVVPAHFAGRNSAAFQLAGLLHPRLRTALLPKELLGNSRRAVRVRFGRPFPRQRLEAFRDGREVLDHLRLRTYILAHRAGGQEQRRRLLPRGRGRRGASPAPEPLAPPEDPAVLSAELGALPPENVRLRQNGLAVFLCRAREAPAAVREIGRLREETFRWVGEGTGRARDLDEFDRTYQHLFVWSERSREIVGAYRLASTADVLRSKGVDGLYTSTLFHMEPALFAAVGPALELGRSFVRREHQRSYAPLLLLWKGIGSLLIERPEHRALFGALSISDEFRGVSRSLMAHFLTARGAGRRLQAFVRPRHRFHSGPLPGTRSGGPPPFVGELEHLCESVADVEDGARDVPVLLREYVKLGARLLGMTLDPAFGNTLDALVLIDLDRTPQRLLRRYLGDDGARRFLARRPAPRDDRAAGWPWNEGVAAVSPRPQSIGPNVPS